MGPCRLHAHLQRFKALIQEPEKPHVFSSRQRLFANPADRHWGWSGHASVNVRPQLRAMAAIDSERLHEDTSHMRGPRPDWHGGGAPAAGGRGQSAATAPDAVERLDRSLPRDRSLAAAGAAPGAGQAAAAIAATAAAAVASPHHHNRDSSVMRGRYGSQGSSPSGGASPCPSYAGASPAHGLALAGGRGQGLAELRGERRLRDYIRERRRDSEGPLEPAAAAATAAATGGPTGAAAGPAAPSPPPAPRSSTAPVVFVAEPEVVRSPAMRAVRAWAPWPSPNGEVTRTPPSRPKEPRATPSPTSVVLVHMPRDHRADATGTGSAAAGAAAAGPTAAPAAGEGSTAQHGSGAAQSPVRRSVSLGSHAAGILRNHSISAASSASADADGGSASGAAAAGAGHSPHCGAVMAMRSPTGAANRPLGLSTGVAGAAAAAGFVPGVEVYHTTFALPSRALGPGAEELPTQTLAAAAKLVEVVEVVAPPRMLPPRARAGGESRRYSEADAESGPGGRSGSGSGADGKPLRSVWSGSGGSTVAPAPGGGPAAARPNAPLFSRCSTLSSDGAGASASDVSASGNAGGTAAAVVATEPGCDDTVGGPQAPAPAALPRRGFVAAAVAALEQQGRQISGVPAPASTALPPGSAARPAQTKISPAAFARVAAVTAEAAPVMALGIVPALATSTTQVVISAATTAAAAAASRPQGADGQPTAGRAASPSAASAPSPPTAPAPPGLVARRILRSQAARELSRRWSGAMSGDQEEPPPPPPGGLARRGSTSSLANSLSPSASTTTPLTPTKAAPIASPSGAVASSPRTPLSPRAVNNAVASPLPPAASPPAPAPGAGGQEQTAAVAGCLSPLADRKPPPSSVILAKPGTKPPRPPPLALRSGGSHTSITLTASSPMQGPSAATGESPHCHTCPSAGEDAPRNDGRRASAPSLEGAAFDATGVLSPGAMARRSHLRRILSDQVRVAQAIFGNTGSGSSGGGSPPGSPTPRRVGSEPRLKQQLSVANSLYGGDSVLTVSDVSGGGAPSAQHSWVSSSAGTDVENHQPHHDHHHQPHQYCHNHRYNRGAHATVGSGGGGGGPSGGGVSESGEGPGQVALASLVHGAREGPRAHRNISRTPSLDTLPRQDTELAFAPAATGSCGAGTPRASAREPAADRSQSGSLEAPAPKLPATEPAEGQAPVGGAEGMGGGRRGVRSKGQAGPDNDVLSPGAGARILAQQRTKDVSPGRNAKRTVTTWVY
ncbi:hypothetical protein GPECTOR_34g731 [Gonium pectorale]|uniref:Uncharacterized protein n=1 Tax=Gonium pectorale TaxID=33097 RepID=A0A150GCJ6_GONPE|nr:hypothetical protein GPECTOR_34g731 [Gonium pectorale]|eukprot:KXZ47572.1 hypothetical protein GPECTOR_34g731 [Gonium pectorale]